MSRKTDEIKEAAGHILDFFRQTYTAEILEGRLEDLAEWGEGVDCEFAQQFSRAQKLRELYERADTAEIERYASPPDADTMTGGFISAASMEEVEENPGFANETLFNHLRNFDPRYGTQPFHHYAALPDVRPFYKSLMDATAAIKQEALRIRGEIYDNGFREQAQDSSCNNEHDRRLYLVEEFRRQDQVIPLLEKVEKLYSDAIDLSEAVLELSRE